MAYRSSAPKLQDTDSVLLFKIAQSLSAGPLAMDTTNNLLRKIAAVLAAAAEVGGPGSSFTVTNLFATNGTFTTVTAADGNFVNLTAINGSITNLTTSLQQVNGSVVIQPTTDVTQLKLIASPGQTVQAFQIFQSDGVTQVFGVNFSGSTQIYRQAADVTGASLTHLKRGTTGNATAAITIGGQLSQDNYQGWDGAAFVNGAQVTVAAREAFTLTARGSQFEFRTAAVGSTALSLIATLSTTSIFFATGANLLVNGATAPAGLGGGIVIMDASSPTANPAAGTAVYSNSGQLFYRTNTASEGAGQNNRVHNRASTITGAGTNYTLTAATARVDFGTTDAEITLPSDGTYLVRTTVAVTGDAAGAGDDIRIKLRNATDSVDISAESQTTTVGVSSKLTLQVFTTVTVGASKLIQIFAFNATAARGTVISTLTSISYVRLS